MADVKYWPLIGSALWRKPVEAVLIWLAVTAAFTLFGLMVGLHATYDRLIESSRMDRLDVNARFPAASPDGILLPVALRERIARVAGVSAVGTYYWLWGTYRDPHKRARVIAVDRAMRAAWSELPITPAQWDQLFATRSGVLVSRGPADRLGLKEGDTFPLMTPPGTRADGASSWEFHVLAVVPDDPLTGSYILGNYSYVDDSKPVQDRGRAWGFRVAVRDPAQASDVSLRIDGQLANSNTPTITIPDRANWVNAVNSSISVASRTGPVAAAGLFMILLLIANGIAQSVRERTTEFAVLETLGYRNVTLIALVFAEVAIPCLAGALVGTGLAAALTRVPAQFLPTDLAGLPKPTLSWAVLAWVAGCALLLALASIAVPLHRLRRLSVTDALAGR
jgi:putative ABC transport system permease protein